MSYNLKVIKDNPVGFWPLDELYSSSYVPESYNDLSFFYNDPAFYDAASQYTAYPIDKSGCENHGEYVGSFLLNDNILPLVSGGLFGTRISSAGQINFEIKKNYYAQEIGGGLGTKYTSDNDFTLEVWISPSIESDNETPLFADITNNIGLFWENGDVVFKISDTENVRWTVSYDKKSLHIVAIYSINTIRLFVDGKEVISKSVSNNFKFTNSSLNLQIGPTQLSSDSFIVDDPAVYRYSLSSSSIAKHYNDANFYIQPIHVVQPENGILFSCSDVKKKVDFEYVYGISKSWKEFIDENTYYDQLNNCISFYKTDTPSSKTFIINDFIFLPTEIGLSTSKIEWLNDFGISVETSIDGIEYLECKNGEAIPQYKIGSFNATGILYIRITMTSSDTSKYLPRLSYFGIRFYKDKVVYADNSSDFINSENEYALGSLNYHPISRHYKNGIRPESGSGFNIVTNKEINSIEFFFTPISSNANTLFYDPITETKYSWNSSGIIYKNNIDAIYVNREDKTSETNISNFLIEEQPHHVVILFSSPVTETLQFNYESEGGPDNLYNNIAIYTRTLSFSEILQHFDLYTGRPYASNTGSVVALAELDPAYYDNDWYVLQTT